MPEVLDHVLAPLCRLLVARGVPFADLMERMKGHYVRAALTLTETKPTDSRLSVMTGLQRREIARLRQFRPRESRPNHLTRIVAKWQTDSQYSVEGRALPLPRTGQAPSFEALALEIRKDVHPRTTLDMLQQAGTVRLDADGQTVHLIATAYLPLGGSEDQLTYLAENVGDHLLAATGNVLGRDPSFFERAVHYNGLSDVQIAALSERFAQAQMALLEDLNKEAATMKDTAPEGASARFRAGGYFYSEGGEEP